MSRITASTALAQLRDVLDRLAPHPGDRLPTERELSLQMGCSRQTLRLALARLEEEGEIWRMVGKGTFRGRPPLGHSIRETVLLQAASAEQLMQARLMIEPAIAGEAAKRASSAEVDYLTRRVEAGRRASSRSEAEAADAQFHRGVAEVAANPVLAGLLAYLAEARRRAAWQHEWDRTYRRIGVEEFTGLHSDQHAAVVAAIAEGDAGAAEQEMRRHLETIATAMRRDRPSG
ncbi:FadR/GntR family transcriptional regulator [Seohaeicola zhoushanensis]|nr:FCD domain-containing protein [Seohaeicola zhoushanensis]